MSQMGQKRRSGNRSAASGLPRYPRKLIPPLHGAQLKNEQDVHLFERRAFLSRREVQVGR
jgi:hypothetical protein